MREMEGFLLYWLAVDLLLTSHSCLSVLLEEGLGLPATAWAFVFTKTPFRI